MPNHLSPHDRYIRTMMKGGNLVLARQFFEKHLPADIKKLVDLNTLHAKDNSFIDDKLKLQITDLLYSANFSGKIGYLYLLIEHMSRSERFLPLKMLKYVISITEQHIDETGDSKPPIVVPMILFNGDKDGQSYKYSNNLFDLFGERRELAEKLLFGPYQLVDLTTTPDDQLRQPVLYGLVARLMKNIRRQGFASYFEKIISEINAIEKLMGNRYTNTTIAYIFEAGEVQDYDKFVQVIKRELPQIEEEKLMTLAEQFTQKGFKKGLAEGILEGLTKGKAEGKAECQKELTRNFALKLLRKRTPIFDIAELTGLSEKEIKELE